MDMNYLAGRSFSSITSGSKEEDGDWSVKVVMTETLIFPNGQVRTETVEALSKEKEFDLAHKEAMRQVLQEVQDLVYTRGFESLIEARDYERGLEIQDGDTI